MSFTLNRAEPRLPNLQRPDSAFLHAEQNLLVTWPTKLTLTPQLGQSVIDTLRDQGIQPRTDTQSDRTLDTLAAHFPRPGIAAPRWEGVL